MDSFSNVQITLGSIKRTCAQLLRNHTPESPLSQQPNFEYILEIKGNSEEKIIYEELRQKYQESLNQLLINLQGTITDYELLESASDLLSKSFDKSLELSVEKARSCLTDVKLVSSPLSDASRSSYEDSRRLSGHSSDLSSISSPITQISTELKDKKGGARKRTLIPKETKDFLESLFEKKRSPNSRERKAIADKCGLTPVQVRVWFTNKRMRSK